MAEPRAYELRAAFFRAGRAVSVEKVVRKNREVVWRVRWRQHGRNRARTFSTRRDALDFDAERRRAHRAGTLTRLDAGAESLDEYVTGTWVHAHAPQLAPKTRRDYAAFYDRYVSPALGHVALRELTPDAIARLQADLLALGLGHEGTRKTVHVVLKGMLTHAVQSGLILANPARAVRMARAPMREEVRPLAPETIEALRTQLLQRPEQRLAVGSEMLTRAVLDLRDATIVSVLAYGGLRPQELRRLRWTSVKERTLVVGAPKTGRRRSVRLLEHLAADLAEWRHAAPPSEHVFSAEDGGEWTAEGFNKWRDRVFLPAVSAVGLDHARPYDLRHSFASLLLHEGRSVIYVARQLGHGADLTLSTYGHTIDELDDAPRIGADEAIASARALGACHNAANR
jgi:integrase